MTRLGGSGRTSVSVAGREKESAVLGSFLIIATVVWKFSCELRRRHSAVLGCGADTLLREISGSSFFIWSHATNRND